MVKIFRDECGKIYDGSLAYRIVYTLRNFTQHYAMPLTGVNISAGPGRPAQIAVGFHPEDLLNCGHNWKKKERDLLAGLGDFVDVGPILREAQSHINRLFAVQLSICGKPYLAAAADLTKYLTEFPDRSLGCVVEVNDDGCVLDPTRVDWFPTETIRRLNDIAARTPS